MKHEKVKKLVLSALFAALTCVATLVIHIPTPGTNGYVNLGDAVVLLGAFVLGPVWGAAAGGIGSALADLVLGYMSYVPGTLIIKGLMGLAAALLFRTLGKKGGTLWPNLAGGVVAELIMVFGYFAYESTLLGYGLAAAASIPANAVQGVAGLVIGVALYQVLSRAGALKLTQTV
ncbi:MAG: ECF transporter S component [Oscillospiraceae bacterium]